MKLAFGRGMTLFVFSHATARWRDHDEGQLSKQSATPKRGGAFTQTEGLLFFLKEWQFFFLTQS